MKKSLALFALIIAGVTVISGCGGGAAAATAKSVPFSDADAIAVVVANTANVPAPTIPESLAPTIQNFRVSGRKPAVISAAGLPSTVDIKWIHIPEGGGTEAGNSKRAKKDLKNLTRSIEAGPSSDGLDMFEALSVAAADLKGAEHPLLILVGSGLSDRGVLDTTDGLLAADPNDVAQYVVKNNQGLSLKGYDVVLSGFGFTAAPQSYLPSSTREQVVAIWTAVLQTLGANVHVDPTPNTAAAISTEYQVEPTVVQPAAACAEQSITYTFDSSRLSFAKESAQLGDASSLEDLAKMLAHADSGEIKISGHTDSDGPESENLALGQARAEAVRAYLQKANPALTFVVESAGESQPVVPETGLSGRSLLEAQGKNRRVEVTLKGTSIDCPSS